VDQIREIDRSRTLDEGFYLALWSEDINLVGEEIDTNALQKFIGVFNVGLVFDEVLNPREFFADALVEFFTFLVAPVGSNA